MLYLCFINVMFMLHKWHVYNLQVMMLGLQTCFAKDEKNIEKGAFLPQFCINIQNDRKIANKVLFFHNAQNYS